MVGFKTLRHITGIDIFFSKKITQLKFKVGAGKIRSLCFSFLQLFPSAC